MIPNQFHFIFGLRRQTEPFHLVHYLCLESCLQVNQPEKIYFYYHYQPYGYYWELIKDKLQTIQVPLVPYVSKFKYRDRFINQFRYAHHSDFIRLEKLIQHGGIYADMDTLFVKKLPSRLFDKPFVLGREPDIFDPNTKRSTPSICNAFIMSPAGAQFGIKWLRQMGESFDGTWSSHSTLLPHQLSEQFPELIHIEPINTFYKFPANRTGIADLFENLVLDVNEAASIHLWAHLWWSKLRMDFSTFHAGMITEDYVRNSDTTYAVLARKFLPKIKIKSENNSKKLSVWGFLNRTQYTLQYIKHFFELLVKIIVINLLGDSVFPNAKEDLKSAKQQLKFLVSKKL